MMDRMPMDKSYDPKTDKDTIDGKHYALVRRESNREYCICGVHWTIHMTMRDVPDERAYLSPPEIERWYRELS